MYKFFVFSPRDNNVIQAIIDAATQAGAGKVGNYSHCAFITEGMGTWLPLPGANPTVGKLGELATEDEVKIEMECAKDKMQDVVDAIKKVHPYDKIAIDAIAIARFE